MNASEVKTTPGISKRWITVGAAVAVVVVGGWIGLALWSPPCSVSVTPACIEIDEGQNPAWATVEVKPGWKPFRVLESCRKWKVSALPDWLRAERIEGRRGPNLKLSLNPGFQGEVSAVGSQGKVCIDWPSRLWSRLGVMCRASLTVARPPREPLAVFSHRESPDPGSDFEELFTENEPAVVAAHGERFLAVWAQEGALGGDEADSIDAAVVARIVDKEGRAGQRLVLQPPEDESESSGEGEHVKPGLAGNGEGTFLVAWAAREDDSFVIASLVSLDLPGEGIPSKPTVLEDYDLGVESSCSADDTAVAYDPESGRWLVLWDLDGDCNEGDHEEELPQIQWALFGRGAQDGIELVGGSAYGDELPADQTTVAADPAQGGFLVAWADEVPEDAEETATPTRIRLARLTAGGSQLEADPIVVSEDSDDVYSSSPALACSPDGDTRTCLLLWSSSDLGEEPFQRVQGRFLQAVEGGGFLQGRLGETFTVAETGSEASLLAPGVAWQGRGDRGGRFLAAWSRQGADDYRVFARWVEEGALPPTDDRCPLPAASSLARQSTRGERPHYLACPSGGGPCLVLFKQTAPWKGSPSRSPVEILGTFFPPPAS